MFCAYSDEVCCDVVQLEGKWKLVERELTIWWDGWGAMIAAGFQTVELDASDVRHINACQHLWWSRSLRQQIR